MKFLAMRFSSVLLLLLALPVATSFQFQISCFAPTVPLPLPLSRGRAALSLKALSSQSSAYETVLEFNAQFKQGLQFAIDNTNTHTNVNSNANINSINDYWTTKSSPTLTLDDMARDAHNTLQAARGVVFEAGTDSVYNEEALEAVGGAMKKIQENWLQQPQVFVNGIDSTSTLLEGSSTATTSTPLLDYVTSTLLSASSSFDSTNVRNSLILPDDFEKVGLGFEVKVSLLENVQVSRQNTIEALTVAKDTAVKIGSYVGKQTQVSFANSAPARAEIRRALVETSERMGEAGTKFVPYFSEQTKQSIANSAPAREQIRSALVANGQKVQDATAKLGSVVATRVEAAFDSTAPTRDQIKERMLANGHRVQDAGAELGSYIRAQAERSYLNGASQIQSAVASNNEKLRDAALASSGRIQENNAAVAERMNAKSAAFSQLINDNAVSLRDQMEQVKLPDFSFPTSAKVASFGLPSAQYATGLREMFRTPDFSIADIEDSLQLKGFGGWYAGAFIGFLVLAAMNDREAGADVKQTATIQPKVSSKPQPVETQQDESEKRRLEGMVMELTEAVAILTNELRNIKSERAQTSDALTILQTDVNIVKDEVGKKSPTTEQLQSKLSESMAQIQNLNTQLETARFDASSLDEEVVNSQMILEPHPPGVPPQVSKDELDGSAFFASIVEKGENLPNITDEKGQENEWTFDRNPVADFVAYWTSKRKPITTQDDLSLQKSDV